MANRGGRAALERYQARMSEVITVEDEPDDPAVEVVAEDEGDGQPTGGGVTDPEPEDDGPSIDYSHEDAEPERLATAATKPPAEPDAAIEAMRRQLAELQGRQEAAEADASRARLEADAQHVKHARTLAEAAARKAQADYEAAAAASDWKAASAAQVAIAAAVADLREYQAAEAEIAHELKHPPRRAAAPTQQQAAADPFEAAISAFSEPTRAWVRKNKADLTADPMRGKLAEAGHIVAVSKGITPDTPEYFAFLDKHMGYTVADEPTPKPARKATGKPQVAAPAGGSGASRGSVTEVKLSRDEIAAAKALGMTTAAYARNKARIIENGRDPNSTGIRYSNQTHHSVRR